NIGGLLGDPPAYAGTRFTFSGSGTDLHELFAVYGIADTTVLERIPIEAFEIHGKFAVTNDSFQLTQVQAEVGDAHLQIDGHLAREPDFIGSRLSIVASGADLEDLIADAANIDIQSTEFELSGSIERLPDSLRISDVRLSGVAGSHLKLDVDIGWPLTSASFGEFLLEISAPDASKLPFHHPAFEFSPLPLELEAQGNWRDGYLVFESVRAKLGEAELAWQGIFDRPPDLSATDLRLSINAPDLSALGLLDGEPLPTLPFLLDAHFDGTTQTYRLDRMTGVLGRTIFSGRLDVDFSGPRPYAAAELDFPVLDLRDWLIDDEAATPESLIDDHRVIPDYPLPLDQFRVVDGTLHLTAREVLLESTSFTDALLRAELSDGALRIQELDMSAGRGRFDGTLAVLPAGDSALVNFTMSGQGLQLNITGESDEDLAASPTYDLDIELAGRGNTARELAESLNGRFLLQSEGGLIRNTAIDVLFADFTRELIARLNPFSTQTPYGELTCAVVAFEVTDGTIYTSPNIILQTSKINLVSKGTIDLATEKIDFNFNTRPSRRLSISAGELINPYIRVSGTLNAPKISLNRQGTAIAGGAAVVTGGLSILAQAAWDRTFRKKNPCEAAQVEIRGRQ
ncbi:MAG: AsmA family protein, partial [Gammaproteobacteria bacterium]|nr:AsmA family protein [Gammaproteobacteria bacterium]